MSCPQRNIPSATRFQTKYPKPHGFKFLLLFMFLGRFLCSGNHISKNLLVLLTFPSLRIFSIHSVGNNVCGRMAEWSGRMAEWLARGILTAETGVRFPVYPLI